MFLFPHYSKKKEEKKLHFSNFQFYFIFSLILTILQQYNIIFYTMWLNNILLNYFTVSDGKNKQKKTNEIVFLKMGENYIIQSTMKPT